MDLMNTLFAGKVGGGGAADAVRYSEQALTGAQKAQARANIGASDTTSGLADDIKSALLNCFRHVAWTDDQGQNCVNALAAAFQKWSYNISELTKVTGTCGNNANAACGMTLEYAGSSNPYRRSFMLGSGKTSIAIQTPGSSTIESQTSDYYPIKIPEGATSLTVSMTPQTQLIQILVRQLNDGVYSSYTTVGPTGYNQGPVTKTFEAAPDNVYAFVTTKYNSTGTSYPVEPTGLDIKFE